MKTRSTAENPRKRLRRSQQIFARRLDDAGATGRETGAVLRRLRPGWLIAGGLVTGVVIAVMPQRALVAAAGALAGFAVRLLNTPLGPMAVGAMLGRRDRNTDTAVPGTSSRLNGHDRLD